jgi:hypothetical protein
MDKQQKLVTAGVVFVLAAGIYFYWSGKKDDSATCRLTSAGITLITAGLSKGHSAEAIIAEAGIGAGTDIACEKVVKSWTDGGSGSVTVDTSHGTETVTLTRDQLLRPAAPPDDALQRFVGCLRWQAPALQQACFDGILDPPAS